MIDLSEISSRVQRDAAPNCPGGIGNYGFNSYDLLTFGLLVMGAVSSAVIVNTNKNENNNKNNDLQASLGSVTSNVQMASADQSSTQGAMIIVSPVGVPSVIPTGQAILMSLLPKYLMIGHGAAPYFLGKLRRENSDILMK